MTIGKTAIAGQRLFTNEAIVALIPKDNRVLPEYLYYVLPRLDYTPYSQPTAKGNTLNKKSIQRVLIPLPPIEEQESLIAHMNVQEEKMNEYKRLAEMTQHESEQYMQGYLSGGTE